MDINVGQIIAKPVMERVHKANNIVLDVREGRPEWFYRAVSNIAMFLDGENVVYTTHNIIDVDEGKYTIYAFTATRLIRTRVEIYDRGVEIQTTFRDRRKLIRLILDDASNVYSTRVRDWPIIKSVTLDYGDELITLPLGDNPSPQNEEDLGELFPTLLNDQLAP
jgi:hypothetical protein